MTESAAIVTPARSDQAGGGEKTRARKDFTERGWIFPTIGFVGRRVARLQPPVFNIGDDSRPQLNSVSQRQCVGMWRAFIRTRENMESAQDNLAAAAAVPVGKLKGALREGEVDGDSDHFGHRIIRRPPVENIFIPVLNSPGFRSGGGETGQRQRGCQYVFAETRVGIFGIEGIDEKRVTRLDGPGTRRRIKVRRMEHFMRNPTLAHGAREGLTGVDHVCTLYYKVLCVKKNAEAVVVNF